MLKKLLTVSVLLFLASCGGKSKSDQFKIDEKAAGEDKGTYQTIENEAQAQAMNQQAQATEIEVRDRVFFAYDSAELSEDAKKTLDNQVAWLKSDDKITVTVEGHCDERGTREYNIALGERRANSAKNYLVKNGIAEARIKTISYGKERPAFFGNTEEIFAKNRRAVTVVN
jgi:peptidoglycan-associated lipoprotein